MGLTQRPSKSNLAFVMESMISADSSLEFGNASEHDAGTSQMTDITPPAQKGLSKEDHRENKLLRCSKLTIILLLAGTTAVCASLTFFIFNRSDQEQYEISFQDYATEITQVSTINAENIYASIIQMSTTISSYALDTEQDFPFVTVPHFEYRGTQILALSGADYLSFNVIVDESVKIAWQNYSIDNQGWIQEGLDAQKGHVDQALTITPYIHKANGQGQSVPDLGPADPYYAVTWQITPAPKSPALVNFNDMSGLLGGIVARVEEIGHKAMSRVIDSNDSDPAKLTNSLLVQPLYKELDPDIPLEYRTFVAYLSVLLPWESYFRNVLAEGTPPLHLVLSNTCGQVMTFEIDGPDVYLLDAQRDIHNPAFNDLGVHQEFYSYDNESATGEQLHDGGYKSYCLYDYSIYPTDEFEESYKTPVPALATIGVIMIFLITSAVFCVYDMLVTRRHKRIESTAARSNALVSSLFPNNVRDRLLADQMEAKKSANFPAGINGNTGNSFGDRVNTYSNEKDNNAVAGEATEDRATKLLRTKPIADLFPNATVMFADICGFTAWSSVREPAQVFTLLEQIYNNFDILARKRRIFKVETIGDCYVAAAGLPDPRPDHALALCRFANECLYKMHTVVKKLEVRLGPDTAELGMRFGLHSGPVTAGVLRGEKSRFQLFGDTVNTAARIESTGERNRIHLSSVTAKFLIDSGKESWVKKRNGKVTAKGKGEIETYWLSLSGESSNEDSGRLNESISAISSNSTNLRLSSDGEASPQVNERKTRLVAWNVDVLSSLLRKIMAMRVEDSMNLANVNEDTVFRSHGMTVLDECKEIIALPQREMAYQRDSESILIDPEVMAQLRDFVTMIAGMYRNNSFHNFEHASHVTQSVTKLLSRIVTSDDIDYKDLQYKKKGNFANLHEFTYGITSDPITQFACAFSALIHDVDHTGVPNATLVKEGVEIADLYSNKSVAEQNSVDIAWGLLMEEEFKGLRSLIYSTQEELERFRQLVVNAVMATDIADQDLGRLRKERWEKAFYKEEKLKRASSSTQVTTSDETSSVVTTSDETAITTTLLEEDSNRKATIVIEHLIQASDVSHTMQHWHVYLKWNERLFYEMYKQYQEGRGAADPSLMWYAGEMAFFDFYIIPLAKKLKECGVFGVSSDEYLNYAQANRQEWELKGKSIVEGYMQVYKKMGEPTIPRSLLKSY